MAATEAPRRGGGRRAGARAGWGALALVLACSGMLVLSAAAWTAPTSSAASMVLGTLDLAAAPASAVVSSPGLTPGDATHGELVVTNSGSLALRWSATVTTSEDTLGPELELTVRSGMADCGPTGYAVPEGTLVAGPTSFGSSAGVEVIGDPATGADPGDRVLAAGASETLCLRVRLPDDVDEATLAGTTTTATIRLDAEQTANNP